jgi:hypothetical protein
MTPRTFLSILLLTPGLLRAEDPKAPPAKPDEKTAGPQVTVDVEWIAMPHVEANRLLRENLKSAGDHKALRAAVEEMVAKNTARRTESLKVLVPDGKKGKAGSLSTKPCPVDWRFDPAADGGFSIKTAATTTRNIGSTVEVEATVSGDNRQVLLNLSMEHAGQLGELAWKAGNDRVTQPVFTNMTTAGRSRVNTGEWYCQGVFR